MGELGPDVNSWLWESVPGALSLGDSGSFKAFWQLCHCLLDIRGFNCFPIFDSFPSGYHLFVGWGGGDNSQGGYLGTLPAGLIHSLRKIVQFRTMSPKFTQIKHCTRSTDFTFAKYTFWWKIYLNFMTSMSSWVTTTSLDCDLIGSVELSNWRALSVLFTKFAIKAEGIQVWNSTEYWPGRFSGGGLEGLRTVSSIKKGYLLWGLIVAP